MKKLPIGIQTFQEIIEKEYVYVDKTDIAFKLITNGQYYFLSRPRRFGKSLFLDTLKEIYKGNKVLFKGLYIEDKWDFSIKYPVIHINFSTGFNGEYKELNKRIRFALKSVEKELQLSIATTDALECLKELIWQANEKYQQKVVILIDEYDKPILDNLLDKDLARSIRDFMKGFYAIIKYSHAYIQFVFITGVSKFSKINLFSGLNSLNDITLDKRYGNICGYTHKDLQTYFQEYLQGVDLEKVKQWYNGYNFFGDKVYNPFDILLFIDKGFEYRNYWWSTGNPSFLIDLLYSKEYTIPQVEHYEATDEILNSFDVDSIELEALLWQTGYLTIHKKFTERNRIKYLLGIPNLEIQFSLNDFFIDALTQQKKEKLHLQDQLYATLEEGNLDQLKQTITNLFASIPYHHFTKNPMANYEGYYASVLYAYLASLGFPIIPEDITNKGRIDLTVQLPDKVYLFEFKIIDNNQQPALQQIKQKRYFEKYQSFPVVYLIGIGFSKKERNVVDWEVEILA